MKINIRIHADMRSAGDEYRLMGKINYSPERGVYKSTSIPTGLSISKKDWDRKRRVKGLTPECKNIENRIRDIERFGNSLDMSFNENMEALRQFINKQEAQPKQVLGLMGYISKFQVVNKSVYAGATISKYIKMNRKIAKFCEEKKLTDNISEMNEGQQMEFFNCFMEWMVENELSNSTIKSTFRNISAVCKLFKDAGLKITFKQFTHNLKEGNTERTFCMPSEIDLIYQKSFELPKNELEDKAVDTFLWQLNTGCRHQDLYQVVEGNFEYRLVHGTNLKVWHCVTTKKGKENWVPLNQVCYDILDKWKNKKFKIPVLDKKKYNNCLLPVLNVSDANQHLHTFLKRIKELQYTETEVWYTGKKRIEEIKHRWERITTHSARHSYAHKLHANGFSSEKVGHLLANNKNTADKHYKHFDRNDLLLETYNVMQRYETNKVG